MAPTAPAYQMTEDGKIMELPKTEAQWTMTGAEFDQALETAREEGRADLEVRKAALEAAAAAQGDGRDAALFWRNVAVLEAYLRDGTKPS